MRGAKDRSRTRVLPENSIEAMLPVRAMTVPGPKTSWDTTMPGETKLGSRRGCGALEGCGEGEPGVRLGAGFALRAGVLLPR